MPAGSEIEVKRLLVGEAAAARFLLALGRPARVSKRQTNHVFDTVDGRLSATRHALRLRVENSAYVLTAKGPSRAVARSTAAKLEAEITIEASLADAIMSGRVDAQAALQAELTDPAFAELWHGLDQARAGQPLTVVGSFDNERTVVPVVLPSGVELEVEVDRTRFPHGISDEEVEIELPSPEIAPEVEDWLEAVASAAGVVTAPSSPKIARFLRALKHGAP